MKGKKPLLFLLASFILYIMDIISDIYVAFQYYKNGETWWCAITLAFVIVPHVIINTFAAYTFDYGLSGPKVFFMWILQLSILTSFKQELARWKREHLKRNVNITDQHKQHSRDLSLTVHHFFLRLAEAFAESARQWCLQNYIMIKQWHFPWYTILSTFFSLLSLAWSITSLEASYKTKEWSSHDQSSQCPGESNGCQCFNTDIKSVAKISFLLFFIAHLCLLVSRLTSLIIYAYVVRYSVFVVVGSHWLLVFTCVLLSKKFNIISITELGLNFILSASMVFCLSSSITKLIFPEAKREKVVFVFYGILLLENAFMVIFAINSDADHINFLTKIALPVVFVGFILGVVFLVLYYQRYHPGKLITENNVESTTPKNVTSKRRDTFCNIEIEMTPVNGHDNYVFKP